jgi:2-phospho-L-lactate/phosphoenolpyruvate guanylyltransferase
MKPLAHAKYRLAPVLSPEERRALSLAMLTDVIAAGAALDAVWAIVTDDDARSVAEAAGAVAQTDPTPADGLNASLRAVTADAVAAGFTGALVISADCPAVTQEDVRALAPGLGVALAPNLDGTGTNALWRSPCDAIDPYYGPGSRLVHMSVAHGRGVPFAVVPRSRMARDVDTPADLDAVWALGPGPATRTAMEALGYPSRRGNASGR